MGGREKGLKVQLDDIFMHMQDVELILPQHSPPPEVVRVARRRFSFGSTVACLIYGQQLKLT